VRTLAANGVRVSPSCPKFAHGGQYSISPPARQKRPQRKRRLMGAWSVFLAVPVRAVRRPWPRLGRAARFRHPEGQAWRRAA
jgi:hypothetical protein